MIGHSQPPPLLEMARSLIKERIRSGKEGGSLTPTLYAIATEDGELVVSVEAHVGSPPITHMIETILENTPELCGYLILMLAGEVVPFTSQEKDGDSFVIAPMAAFKASTSKSKGFSPDSFLVGILESPEVGRTFVSGFCRRTKEFGKTIEVPGTLGGKLTGMGPCHSWS